MKNIYTYLLFVVALTQTALARKPEPQTKNRISAFVFTENKGQVHDQYNNAVPDVLFGGTDGNLIFHLKNNSISYQLNRVESWKENSSRYSSGDGKILTANKNAEHLPYKTTIYRLDINWLNTNADKIVTANKTVQGFTNYYSSTCPKGALNVRSFEQITYKQIYSGIDLVWYQKNGHLKYDYLVAADANYKQIELQVMGAEKISLNSNGELLFKTPLGDIIEHAPLVKQNGKVLKSKWLIKNNIVSFEINDIDKNSSFVIDPCVRGWGTYYGGTASEYGNGCAVDANGNVYLAGITASNIGTIIATVGSHQTTNGGGANDAFIAKFNSAGVRKWGTYYGGAGDEDGKGCCVDLSGNVYLTGITVSNVGTEIATLGSHQPTNGGGTSDAFLVKFNSNGVRQWGTYYGGTNTEMGNACVADANGDVYLTGQTLTNTGTVIATAVIFFEDTHS